MSDSRRIANEISKTKYDPWSADSCYDDLFSIPSELLLELHHITIQN